MDRSFEQYIPKPKAGCDCISYNGHSPDRRGTPETVLTVPDWVSRERRTVCVDTCIAEHVKALWEAGIWTEASCCGHNGLFPRNIVVDRANHAKAQGILDARKAKVQIMSWQLCAEAPDLSESGEGQSDG